MLTPFDIQNRTLKTTMGGYNKKDTDEFMAQILESFEAVYKENRDLKEKITSLSEGIQYYKQMENSLQKALILAEKTSTETQDEAKTRADAIIREAQEKADALVNETKAQTDALVNETKIKTDTLSSEAKAKADEVLRDAKVQADLMKVQAERDLESVKANVQRLVQSYESYRIQFKKIVSEQMNMLESDSFKIYAPALDEGAGVNSMAANSNDMNNNAINNSNIVSGSNDMNNSNDITDNNNFISNNNNYVSNNNVNGNYTNNNYSGKNDKPEFAWNGGDKKHEGADSYGHSDDEAAAVKESSTSNGRYKNNRRYSSKGSSKNGRGNAKFSRNNVKQNKQNNPFTFIDTEDD